jgi:hypothetical protein
MQKEYKHLTSVPFLASLFLLLLNDLCFKALFHNFFTGKLSDFCGIFVFAVFWSVLFPNRRIYVFLLTALFFTVWKSSYSQLFIDFFSEYIFPVHRVIDAGDLVAILVLPLAWYYLSLPTTKSYLSPGLAGLMTIFSFCATSQGIRHQTFEQPQYILFTDSSVNDTSSFVYEDLKPHRFGNLIAVEVKEIATRDWYSNTEYYRKNLILRSLDTTVLTEISMSKNWHLNESASPKRFVIESDGYTDEVTFNGSRLDGKFTRTSVNGKVLIEGKYMKGFEDSIWTFRDSTDAAFTNKTFIKGEVIKTETFDSGKLLHSETINTLNESIRDKKFHLTILAILAGLMTMLIFMNLRKPKDNYPLSALFKTMWSFGLCVVVFFFYEIISAFIPNSFSAPFNFIAHLFLCCFFGLPVFMLIFFWIRIRKPLDILWYCILLALLLNLWNEHRQLEMLQELVVF